MSPERTPTETSPLLGPQSGNAPTNGTVSNNILRDPEADSLKDDLAPRHNLRYILPAVSIGIFLSAADQTIIVASYGQIGSDLKALNLTSWVATSYFITLASFQPLYGKLSDIFGRRACLLFSYFVFGLGCLFCGLARNIHELIAAREEYCLTILAGGGMLMIRPIFRIACCANNVPRAFLAQVPLCVLAFLAVSVMLDLPVQGDSHWKTKLRRIDFPGAFALVGAVVGLLLGLDRGSNVSWTIPLTIVSLCVSLTMFVLFVLIEIYFAAEPFAPGHIIFNRTFFASYCCNFFSFGGWLAGLFFIPLYFQAVDGVSATVSGLRLLPSIIAGVSGSLFAGYVMKWTGKYYWLTIVAYGLLTVGLTTIYLFTGGVTQSLIPMILGMVLCGFGNGIGVTTTLIALISNVTPEDQAVVTACSYLFRSLGSVIGVSLSSTVVQQLLRSQLRFALRDSKDIDRIVEGVRQSLDYIKTLDPTVARIVRGCYGWATNKGFAFMVAIVFFALLSSFFIRESKLSR
ncbi:putative MFS multidrug transporter [Aspergillus fumigatus Af293]|uniref:MFS multidrug transporter, putative n=1 Tax=Aspergillus fumigatus (strain ATCC MYA-4609 / CBS 101355 / FGSC A1100 / Af293) TaxID=330879 RepID=Q4WN77_ASPFU|nr:MFS multidrug transporter, putative [Aspergillus fumigatus Af293]EAL88587.1 MFS multidrug transporter, putative [Aspergillus fumigatus Af293]KEY80329.1 MFS multidrug transporter [Aspergillus fumigatus]